MQPPGWVNITGSEGRGAREIFAGTPGTPLDSCLAAAGPGSGQDSETDRHASQHLSEGRGAREIFVGAPGTLLDKQDAGRVAAAQPADFVCICIVC